MDNDLVSVSEQRFGRSMSKPVSGAGDEDTSRLVGVRRRRHRSLFLPRIQRRLRDGRCGCVKRTRRLPQSLPLLLQLLLGYGDRIVAGDEAARRWLLARDHDERLGELGRVAGLLTVLGLIRCPSGGVALGVVPDGRLGIGRRLLSEKLGAEAPTAPSSS